MESLITADNIKKEIEDEVEIPVIWRQEDIKEEDPLADVKSEDVGVVHDLVPKVKTETSFSAVKRELRICLKRLSVADLVVKLKSPRAVEPVLETDNKGSEGVECSGITLHCNESFIPLNPLNESSKLDKNRRRQVERHRKSKMSADTNISSSTSNLYTKTTYTREICNICFNSQAKYKKHLLNHSKSELLSCAHCSYKTLYKDELISHIEKHLREVKKQYTCNVCFYKCFHFASLKTHMRTHTGEKPYTCKVCSHSCSQAGNLKAHMLTHSKQKSYMCKVCSYKCLNYCFLKMHMQTHTEEKPYSCKDCSFKSSSFSSLKSHMRTHTGEKTYTCKVCSYKSCQGSSLTYHMLTHTGEKPFSCNICSYKFSRSTHLKYHMRTHSKEKPFSCNVCSYKCNQPSSLKYHIRTHTGEKPYTCKVCSRSFSRSSHFKLHMQTYKGENLIDVKFVLLNVPDLAV